MRLVRQFTALWFLALSSLLLGTLLLSAAGCSALHLTPPSGPIPLQAGMTPTQVEEALQITHLDIVPIHAAFASQYRCRAKAIPGQTLDLVFDTSVDGRRLRTWSVVPPEIAVAKRLPKIDRQWAKRLEESDVAAIAEFQKIEIDNDPAAEIASKPERKAPATPAQTVSTRGYATQRTAAPVAPAAATAVAPAPAAQGAPAMQRLPSVNAPR